MLNQNDTEYYGLSGALAFDPCIGQFDYTQEEAVVVPFVEANNNLLNFNESFLAELQSLHQSCGYADCIEKYMTFPPPGVQPAIGPNITSKCDIFDLIDFAAFDPNPCFNVYEVTNMCPIMGDVLGFPTQFRLLLPRHRGLLQSHRR